MSKRMLVLTGFMGTGKSTLGAAVAEQTQVPFIDLDNIIAQKSGMAIPDIFEQMGEAGFRAWERTACVEIGQMDGPAVVATGGGALMDPMNRQAFSTATIVCLHAPAETILERLADDNQRPLLRTEDVTTRVRQLLHERQPAYSLFRWQVDTSVGTIASLTSHILDIWERDSQYRQHEQRVQSPEGSYPLLIEEGSLDHITDYLDIYGLAGRKTIVATDSNVASLYGEMLAARIPDAELLVMPAGEHHKHLDTVVRMLDKVAHRKLDRNGLMIALGGGVVGDTLGYVAAAYMRGIRLVQIPTSLLAMVDSSVGGKVGVDTPMGKNLVGAFKQPELVIIDPNVLATLPDAEFRAGMAEIIKHGLLANPDLLNKDMPLLTRIQQAIQVKIDIVQRDPFERGERAHLNLGHTFGHALERVSGYSWRHGDAVAVGLVGAAMLSQALGMLDESVVRFVQQTIQDWGLPTTYRYYPSERIYEAMTLDKKWQDGRSHFVLLEAIGSPVIVKDVPKETVLDVLERLRE